MKNLIFLISMPRSGSTLLQKILVSHSQISSHAEPWVLLPLIFGLKRDYGIKTIYSQKAAYYFMQDLNGNLKHTGNFDVLIRDFILKLYGSFCEKNKMYFLDKTPRYYLIVNTLFEIFPEAKFIFLYRNPIAVFSSIISSKQMCDNKLYNLDKYFVDLEFGLKTMMDFVSVTQNNLLKIRYEDLVVAPELELKKICNFLELDVDDKMLTYWKNAKLLGTAGDKEGLQRYDMISRDSLEKFREVFGNLVRKSIAINYIRKIPDDKLEMMNYSKKSILKKLRKIKVSYNVFMIFFEMVSYLCAKIKYFFKKKILEVK